MSYGGKCNMEGWVLTGGMAPLFWWFSGGSVSLSASSVIPSSSVWEKNTVGCAIASSSSSATSCISSSLLVCTASSGVLAGLVSEVSSDST